MENIISETNLKFRNLRNAGSGGSGDLHVDRGHCVDMAGDLHVGGGEPSWWDLEICMLIEVIAGDTAGDLHVGAYVG